MPTLVALPDALKSMQTYLSGVPEVAALVSTSAGWMNGGSGARIGMVLGANWRVPTTAIRLRRAGGRGQIGAGRHETRVDVWYMGANEREAVNLWRTVQPALCPLPGDGVIGWTANNCRVTDVVQDAGPIPADDIEVGWSVLLVPYLVYWREVPTP